MTLQNLQAEFVEAVLNHQALEGVRPLSNLSIYHNNILSHLVAALFHTYPLIVKLVGEDFFHVMANHYINAYPSRSGNLNEYGEYFADFITEYEPVRHLPYLSEVAQFEWTCRQVFYAADHAALDKTQLAGISPDHYHELFFSLHPASQLMSCRYPMLRIIDLCKGETEDVLDVHEGGVDLLIIRRELALVLVALEKSDFAFLQALQNQASLEQALRAALQFDSNFKLDEKLPKWIQEKTIVAVQITP